MGGVCAGASAHAVKAPSGAVSSVRAGQLIISTDDLLNGDLSAVDVSEHGTSSTADGVIEVCAIILQTP